MDGTLLHPTLSMAIRWLLAASFLASTSCGKITIAEDAEVIDTDVTVQPSDAASDSGDAMLTLDARQDALQSRESSVPADTATSDVTTSNDSSTTLVDGEIPPDTTRASDVSNATDVSTSAADVLITPDASVSVVDSSVSVIDAARDVAVPSDTSVPPTDAAPVTCSAPCVNGTCVSGTCACTAGWSGSSCNLPFADCAQILAAAPSATSGDYTIDVDGSGGLPPIVATCDMTTDGGGWTLVLNYVHQGGTNPATRVRTVDLPRMGTAALGVDESSSASNWGHAGNAMLSRLATGELFFESRSAGSSRQMSFVLTNQDCIDYFRSGTGTCIRAGNGAVPLASHSARLPASIDSGFVNQGNDALTNYPFYQSSNSHWAIRGNGNAWEADTTLGNGSEHTIHRVWTRPPCATGRYGNTCASTCSCTDGSCSDGRRGTGVCSCGRHGSGTGCAVCAFGWTGASCDTPAGINATPQVDCAAVLAAAPTAPTGYYMIDTDGAGGDAPIEAYCDMTTDGGGWTLVLNYVHRGGTNPMIRARTTSLPFMGSNTVGEDESANSAVWGHAGNALLARFSVGEMLFEGRTSSHTRELKFITRNAACIAHAQSGSGSCIAIGNGAIQLPSHTGRLPQSVDSAYTNQGDNALTNFPFYRSSSDHWAVRGNGNRWEIDTDLGDARASTIHRVWVRPQCAAGTYGVSCASTCSCSDGTCDQGRRGTGACVCGRHASGPSCGTCAFGWTGPSCDTPTGVNASPLTDCSAIQLDDPSAPSGYYVIDPDGAGSGAPFEASCDMTSDGGGWTLVLNYVHQGGTNPALNVRTNDLPLLVSNTLGADEGANALAWGHAGNAMLNRLAVDQMLFEARTNAHAREMRIVASDRGCIDYAKTGTGSCALLPNGSRPLAGHSTRLPDSLDQQYTNQGNLALTSFPFYRGSRDHWAARGNGDRWEVDTDLNSSSAHTIHRVWVRTQCPAGTYGNGCSSTCACPGDSVCVDGREGSGACVCGRHAGGLGCSSCALGWTGPACDIPDDVNLTPEISCAGVLAAVPSAPDGYYIIDPDGPAAAFAPMEAYCDMTTDGGGWTLVLNYAHNGGRNPNVRARTTSLPILGRTTLTGADESGSPLYWGHAAPALLAAFVPTEIRFEARTSGHARVLDFTTRNAPCISYLTTGLGSCRNVNLTSTLLPGHTGLLPGVVGDAFTDQRDFAMTNFPFWRSGQNHWGVRGLNERWEVDDYPNNPANDTIHHVWIR